MLIPKELILSAKQSLGEKSAITIAKDLKLEDFDEKNLKGKCYFHKEDSASFIWNSKENSYKCFGCGKVYGILDHYMSFYKLSFLDSVEKLFSEAKIEYRFSERGVKKSKDYSYPKPVYNKDKKTLVEYWSSRGISEETLDYAGVQQDAHGNTVFHYYDTNDVLCVVKYRPSKKVMKGENKFWAQQGADTMPLLYGINQADPTKPLVITEGEPDRLALIEAGYKNAVSVPFGANNFSWIEHNWDFLEQFEKIIVWSDNDKPGIEMRKEVCTRLGTWKTLFVDLPTRIEKDGVEIQVKDINEVLFHFGKQKVLDYVSNAVELPVTNVVDLSNVDDFDIESAPGLYTCIKELDNIVYKFVLGSVVLLTGSKGSGKSTFLNQVFICEALNQGNDVFVFSGELGNPVLKNWIETTMAGKEKIKMKNDFVRVIEPQTKKAMRDWYKGRIWSFDDTENNADKILDRAINVTRRFGTKVWILDNLMTLDIGANDNNLWQKQKEFIVKIVTLAKTYGVLIILVAHPRKTTEIRRLVADDIAGSNDLGNLAQYIIGVHRFSKAEKEGERSSQTGKYKKGKEPIDEDVSIDVFKNRFTGRIGDIKLFFDYPSMRFYSNDTELFKRYKWNTDTSPTPKMEKKESSPFDNDHEGEYG